MRPRPSLKARGIQLLAQREHSRSELRAKLLRHALVDRVERQAQREAVAEEANAGAAVESGPSGLVDGEGATDDAHGSRLRSRRPARRLTGGGSDARRVPPDAASVGAGHIAPPDDEDPEVAVDRTLDWLQAHHYLDEDRFVESRVHARAGRYGNLRIRQELAQHGVALSDDAAAALKQSELERARSVWQRKFGQAPVDVADRARQMRFLAGRGFSAEVIRRVVAGHDED